jgi:hypothetical protein
MALAYQIPLFPPEVLAMDVPTCRLHRVAMTEIKLCWGCFKCPVDGCEETADLPPKPEPPHCDACLPPAAPMPQDSPLIQRAAGFWLSHIGIRGPISVVPQSNARDDWSCMEGPPAPGGGSSKSGRKRKKPKKLKQDLWGAEGGTNRR